VVQKESNNHNILSASQSQENKQCETFCSNEAFVSDSIGETSNIGIADFGNDNSITQSLTYNNSGNDNQLEQSRKQQNSDCKDTSNCFNSLLLEANIGNADNGFISNSGNNNIISTDIESLNSNNNNKVSQEADQTNQKDQKNITLLYWICKLGR
jgi:hypothetical protein